MTKNKLDLLRNAACVCGIKERGKMILIKLTDDTNIVVRKDTTEHELIVILLKKLISANNLLEQSKMAEDE
jgi:hypothetical protein